MITGDESEPTKNTNKMPAIGRIENYNGEDEDWTSYVERVELYFAANKIEVDKRVPAILSLMGAKTYALVRSLTAPDRPSTKTFAEIVTILTDHLTPKPLVIAERFRFHKRNQLSGENIQAFVAELKKLSRQCDFGANLNDSLRDCFVCGIQNENIFQKRLLSEANLTYQRAVELAIAMETAAKDAEDTQICD